MNEPSRSPDSTRITALHDELAHAGVRTVIGTAVNSAGLTLAKSVPVARLGAFHRNGMGAAGVWHVFCADGDIAFTDAIGAVGDMRLRLDLDGLRDLGGGLAWGPADFFAQSGERDPRCPRGLLRAVELRLAHAGLEARVGHELEFVLVAPDGSALEDTSWVPYGVTGLLDREDFLADLLAATAAAGIGTEQVHCEYGRNQFEFSLPPVAPVAAADATVLAKTLVGRVARRHGLRASFSPLPFPGGLGNGAHQHFSLTRDGKSLFGGGDGPYGMTAEGGAAIGGVVRGLPDVQGLLTGSVLSGERLAPGLWSGAHACWGLENREAAVRFLRNGPGNPHGANVEVKTIDPSANVYTASAAVLALALEGISTRAPLPAEVADDPGTLTDQQRAASPVTVLPHDIAAVIDLLDKSSLARRLVGDAIVDTTVVTRRHEQTHHAEKSPEERAELFRLAWSV
ncbi:glutamine synthetase [Streptomyces sp. NPDC101062]|uniref:glutamine synthetase n=1 Tax=unclassified Streptomyces TaxID=2593676 RepID=UPI0037FD4EAE